MAGHSSTSCDRVHAGRVRLAWTLLAVVIPVLAAATLAGCYSFRTGSAPAHLKTIGIPPADDASGFGRGTIRQDLTDLLTRRFRDDGSLRVSDPATADSRLEVTITSIRTNERLSVSNASFETVRGVTIETKVTFYDNVKKRAIFKDRPSTGRSQYLVDQGPDGETRAIREALSNLGDDLINATVADW
ncbi:MAG: hypothetical protein JST22_13630 [Bacteroidetes bacterium]|nr:hypothetical protein [Bacteroidota bacterium]